MDGDNQLASPFRLVRTFAHRNVSENILKVKSMNERIAVDRPVWIVTWETIFTSPSIGLPT